MSEMTQRERISRLLIVEDDEPQLRTLTAIMQDEGFEVIGCSTAAEGLDHIKQENVGVAIVDLRLPDLSGTRLLEQLQTLNGAVRIIINTAYGSFDSAKDAVNLGAFAYVEKAADPEELVRQVHRAFRTHLQHYADDLEVAVASRTSELQQANKALRREITEHKETEEALRESEKSFRALAENATDGILIVTDAGTCRYANKHAGQIAGCAPAALLEAGFKDLSPADESGNVMEVFRNPLGWDTVPVQRETVLLRKDGRRIWVELTAAKTVWQGEPAALVVFRDVTDREAARERSRQHQAELAHVSRLSTMGEMASGIAHELNQPLFTIMNFAQTCRFKIESGRAGPDEILDNLEEITAAAEKAGQIIRRLREFVRKREPRRSTININKIIHEVVSFVESEARIDGIRLRLELALDELRVQGDTVLIQQVILNLARNGIEAMTGSKVDERELTIQTSEAGSDAIEVAVCDTGHGLSGEPVDRLFEAFFTTKPEGLGLGLSISRSIIEAEGGHLVATPNPDRGMTFRFTLPVSQGDQDDGS